MTDAPPQEGAEGMSEKQPMKRCLYCRWWGHPKREASNWNYCGNPRTLLPGTSWHHYSFAGRLRTRYTATCAKQEMADNAQEIADAEERFYSPMTPDRHHVSDDMEDMQR